MNHFISQQIKSLRSQQFFNKEKSSSSKVSNYQIRLPSYIFIKSWLCGRRGRRAPLAISADVCTLWGCSPRPTSVFIVKAPRLGTAASYSVVRRQFDPGHRHLLTGVRGTTLQGAAAASGACAHAQKYGLRIHPQQGW
jgi:hypothetical protein